MRHYKWIVCVAYDYADKRRGDIISRHTTYGLALRRAKQSTMWAIRAIADDDNFATL